MVNIKGGGEKYLKSLSEFFVSFYVAGEQRVENSVVLYSNLCGYGCGCNCRRSSQLALSGAHAQTLINLEINLSLVIKKSFHHSLEDGECRVKKLFKTKT